MAIVNFALNNPCCTNDCTLQYTSYFYAVPLAIAPVVLSILGLTGVMSLQTMAIANISVAGCEFAAVSLTCCQLNDKKDASKTLGMGFVAIIGVLAMNILGFLHIVPLSYVPIATIGAVFLKQLSAYVVVYCLARRETQSSRNDKQGGVDDARTSRTGKPRKEAMPGVPWDADRLL
jgi:hypothetical protein